MTLREQTAPTHPGRKPALTALEHFAQQSRQAFVAHDVRPDNERRFRGSLDARQAGDVTVALVRSGYHTVERTRRHVEASDNSRYKVSLQLTGTSMISQGDVISVLHPGDFVIYDTVRPYRFRYRDAYSAAFFTFPKVDLPLPAGQVARLGGHALHTDTPAGATFRAFAASLAENLTVLDGPDAVRMGRAAIDVLTFVLGRELGEAPDPRREAFDRIVAFIEAHLADPDLTPSRIAEAHHVSLSHLHQLFRGQGRTVAGTVRALRLERAHRALTDPANVGRPLTAVAAEVGFLDPAHFSRVYKLRYGRPPRDARPSA